ncbi:hypothetical protein CALVIDRAFT_541481 [Calocera viscosa TUFC12733]|uniref:Uncharacterized protein n=1 Tax=Calocera viscosa (strain TUFC12733) TaxID=1330018 RepID=A0A167HQ34_CALVF|nr:hypothetical protein CALVIDRAFT_541481 [Calocera viscosa TUFC12733]
MRHQDGQRLLCFLVAVVQTSPAKDGWRSLTEPLKSGFLLFACAADGVVRGVAVSRIWWKRHLATYVALAFPVWTTMTTPISDIVIVQRIGINTR